MDARFQLVRSRLWILESAHSRVRDDGGGSAAALTVLEAGRADSSALRDLLARFERTDEIRRVLAGAPEGETEIVMAPGDSAALPLRAAWNEEAAEAARQGMEPEPNAPLLPLPLWGLLRAELNTAADGSLQVALHGYAESFWKFFRSRWWIELHSSGGTRPWLGAADADLQIEDLPVSFEVRLDIPATAVDPSPRGPFLLRVRGEVVEHLGSYRHGAWWRRREEKSRGPNGSVNDEK